MVYTTTERPNRTLLRSANTESILEYCMSIICLFVVCNGVFPSSNGHGCILGSSSDNGEVDDIDVK